MFTEIKQKAKYGEVEEIDSSLYHEFKEISESSQWGMEKYKDWAENYKNIFTYTEQYKSHSVLNVANPVEMYCGYAYTLMNEFLRNDEPEDAPSHIRNYISNLVISIYSAPVVNQRIVLYRQVPDTIIEELVQLNKKKNGQPFHEKGFMSTSMVKSVCAETCGPGTYMLKMYVEAPIHAIYANAVCQRDEEELLLPPGLFMRMVGYPYKDKQTGLIIFEVSLFGTIDG